MSSGSYESYEEDEVSQLACTAVRIIEAKAKESKGKKKENKKKNKKTENFLK